MNILALSLEQFANLDGIATVVLDDTQFDFTRNSKSCRRLAFIKTVDLNAIESISGDRFDNCPYGICDNCSKRTKCESDDINLFTDYYHICKDVVTNNVFYIEDDANQNKLNALSSI